jgi:hypothetical protein
MKQAWMVVGISVLLAIANLAVADEPAAGEEGTGLPVTFEQMKARHAQIALEPQGAARCFLDAVFVYQNEATRDEARKMIQYLAIPLKDQPDWDTNGRNRLMRDRMIDPAYAHVWRSYARGTAPDNGYAMDPNNWELNFERTHQHPNDDRGLQVYLRSSGADNPRVVYVKKSTSTGLYYLNLFPSLYVDIRPPVDPNAEKFE